MPVTLNRPSVLLISQMTRLLIPAAAPRRWITTRRASPCQPKDLTTYHDR